MSFDLQIIKEPKITATTGTASRWSMVQNPLLFKFQRKDLIIKAVTDSGGGVTKLAFFDSPYWITAGDSIWWGDTLNQNDNEYLVTSVDKVNNFIEIGTILSGHVLGWVNDTTNIQNYHVFMDLFEWLGSGQQGDRIAFAKFYDDPKGLIIADLRDYLETKVGITIPSFFGVATRHNNMDQDYSFTYRPGFVHTTIDPTGVVPSNFNTRYFAFKSSAQLGDQYGQNMRRYMTYPAIDPLNTNGLMHFNSMFDEPYFFDGYPFLMSFVYSEKLIATRINRCIRYLDINLQEFELLLNGSFDDTSAWTLNGTGISISGGALKFAGASHLAYGQQELITPIEVGTDNYRITIDITGITDKFFQLIAANGSTVVHQFGTPAGTDGEFTIDFNTSLLSATAVFLRFIIDVNTSADDTGDLNEISIVKTFVDLIPYTIKEHGCVITTRGIGSLPSNVHGLNVWLEDSETVVEEDGEGSGGGGGTDLDVGGGGTDISTLEPDIVEDDIIF